MNAWENPNADVSMSTLLLDSDLFGTVFRRNLSVAGMLDFLYIVEVRDGVDEADDSAATVMEE